MVCGFGFWFGQVGGATCDPNATIITNHVMTCSLFEYRPRAGVHAVLVFAASPPFSVADPLQPKVETKCIDKGYSYYDSKKNKKPRELFLQPVLRPLSRPAFVVAVWPDHASAFPLVSVELTNRLSATAPGEQLAFAVLRVSKSPSGHIWSPAIHQNGKARLRNCILNFGYGQTCPKSVSSRVRSLISMQPLLSVSHSRL